MRIWDYDKKSLEIVQEFSEEAHGVAFHPSGFHIVVGFTDKLRFMNIIDKRIVAYKEFALKSCKEIRFCTGGHMVAAASGNTIHVFNFYTGECPPNFILKGQDTNITSIYWMSDDTGFLSANWNGTIERWKLKDGTGEVLFSLKGTKMNNVIEVMDKDRWVYAVASDKQIKEIKDKTPARMMDAGVVLGDIIITRKQHYMIAGVEEKQKPGALRVYNFPLTGDFAEVEAHSAEVRRLRVSYNDKYVFSVGADGCFIIYELRDLKPGKGDKEDVRIVYSGEILYSRKELDAKYKEKEKLDEDNEEKKAENEKHQAVLRQSKKEELEIQEKSLEEEEELGKENMKKLQEEKEKTTKLFEESIEKLMSEYEKSKTDEILHHKEKMEEEDNRMAELERAIQLQIEEHRRETEDLSKKHEDMKKIIQAEYSEEIKKLKDLETSLKDEIANKEHDHLKKRAKMERDIWKMLNKEAVANYTELHKVTENKTEADVKLKESSNLKSLKEQEIQNLEHDKATKASELKTKLAGNQELRKERQTIDKDIEEREQTIEQKRKRVEELRKKKQELEKFKFVLDYKMRELKGEMEPKKQEIEKLHEQEVKMDEEVRHFTMANGNMHLIVYDLMAKQQGMTHERENQKLKEQEDDQFKLQFSEDVSELCKILKTGDMKLVKDNIVKLHKKYLKGKQKNTAGQGENQKAHADRRQYYEDKIQSLRSKCVAEIDKQKNDNAKLMKENEVLILQYNELLRDLHLNKISTTKDGNEQNIYISRHGITESIKSIEYRK